MTGSTTPSAAQSLTPSPSASSAPLRAPLRVSYGQRAALSLAEDAVELCVPLPLLAGTHPPEPLLVVEPSAPRLERRGHFALAHTDELLCGAALLEADDVEGAARELLGEALHWAREAGLPELFRVWAVVPRIQEVVGAALVPGGRALDRYMLFCRGRHAALSAEGRDGVRACASTAVGGLGETLCLWFLSARESGQQRENPRQVPAWRYPKDYGPRPPDFARATTAPCGLGDALYVSGTASIAGHQSLHEGDLAAQLEELDQNLRALVGDARPLGLRAYVLRAEDGPAVRADLERRWPGASVLCVRADLCRPELLVEVEALCATAAQAPDAGARS